MTAPRPLAEVEAQAQEFVRTLGEVGGLQAQRDLWREQAYDSADRHRAVHRAVHMLRSTYKLHDPRHAVLTAVLDQITGPEVVDQPTPVAQPPVARSVATKGGAS